MHDGLVMVAHGHRQPARSGGTMECRWIGARACGRSAGLLAASEARRSSQVAGVAGARATGRTQALVRAARGGQVGKLVRVTLTTWSKPPCAGKGRTPATT